MLTFSSPERLATEPPVVRFLHTLVLMAIQDGTERLEFRATDGGWVLYQRVDGRDWETVPPPEDVQAPLKPTLRQVTRLVAPERPAVTVMGGSPDGRFEPHEIGWLTYDLGGRLLDLEVRIDPREPWGTIRIDFADAEGLAGPAGEALDLYTAHLADNESG